MIVQPLQTLPRSSLINGFDLNCGDDAGMRFELLVAHIGGHGQQGTTHCIRAVHNMNPFVVGDIVEFVPLSRSAGYQGDVQTGGISTGYVGKISIIRDGVYVFFEDDRGGAPFTEFRLVRKAANTRTGELKCSRNPFTVGSMVIFCPKHIVLNDDPRFFPYGLKIGDSGAIIKVDRHLIWLSEIPAPMPWWFVKSA